jgi:hypothetical protein
MDESGFPLNNSSLQQNLLVREREVISFANDERSAKVTTVACFNAAGTYASPVILFKGFRKVPQFQERLSPGSLSEMRDSGWVTEICS